MRGEALEREVDGELGGRIRRCIARPVGGCEPGVAGHYLARPDRVLDGFGVTRRGIYRVPRLADHQAAAYRGREADVFLARVADEILACHGLCKRGENKTGDRESVVVVCDQGVTVAEGSGGVAAGWVLSVPLLAKR